MEHLLDIPPRRRLRLTRQSGRLEVSLLCVVLAHIVQVPWQAALSSPDLALAAALQFTLSTLLMGAFFALLWAMIVTFLPLLRAAVEFSAAAYLLAAALPMAAPALTSRVAAGNLVLSMLVLIFLRHGIEKSGLSTVALPWRMRLEHRLYLPLTPQEVWMRLRPVPGAPLMYFDPTVTQISRPDAQGTLRLDHEYRFGPRTRWLHIRHEETGRLMVRSFGHNAEQARQSDDIDTIRLEPKGSGTEIIATEVPRASIRLIASRFLDDFQADYWDRAAAHILGETDGSLWGALMDPSEDEPGLPQLAAFKRRNPAGHNDAP